MNGKAWIGVDLDGTLAFYDGWKGPYHIGEPIWPMVHRVRKWLSEKRTVKIFTARVTAADDRDLALTKKAIEDWCGLHIGQVLEVTNVKDFGLVELWDDRAVSVKANTGDFCRA